MLKAWAQASVALAMCAVSLGGADDQTFTMPSSVLLFANYNELRIVTPDHVQLVPPPVQRGYNSSYPAHPSITSSGDLIAWGFAIGSDDQRAEYRARFALGLYSRMRRSWKTYGDFDEIGDAGISSDGSKVAVVARQQGRLGLWIFDVAAERMSDGLSTDPLRDEGCLPDRSAPLIRCFIPTSTSPTGGAFIQTMPLT